MWCCGVDAVEGGQTTPTTRTGGWWWMLPGSSVLVGWRYRRRHAAARRRRRRRRCWRGCDGTRHKQVLQRYLLDRRRRRRRALRWRLGRRVDGHRRTTGKTLQVLGRQQSAHLVERSVQHQDVVLSEQQRRDLGQFAYAGSVRVGHHLAQCVQRRVEVVHSTALATVHFQAQLLQLLVVRRDWRHGPGRGRSSPSVDCRRAAGPRWRWRPDRGALGASLPVPCRRPTHHRRTVLHLMLKLRQRHRRTLHRRVRHGSQVTSRVFYFDSPITALAQWLTRLVVFPGATKPVRSAVAVL